MVCIKCGQELEAGTKFCTKCGFSMKETAPGNKLLKISGIIFIVFGVFAIISLISSIIGTHMAADMFSEFDIPTVSGFTYLLNVLNILLCLSLGITGVMFCNDITKAKILKYFAFGYIGFYVIYTVNMVINTITSLNAMGVPGVGAITVVFTIIGIIIGVGIPVLYLIGAQKNLKATDL